ncbi:hypothetical protein GCM10008938_51610 [Deinococcus roseus]|uniref:Ankyrin repeat domain-containing protein n=2 Tax=Deinococcus roseus TaxID=392414 RepID=A0ABQ2DIU8_9DEIO|nr:hypothetical protein GCM10008938_51610 [Deinococcus roseus]
MDQDMIRARERNLKEVLAGKQADPLELAAALYEAAWQQDIEAVRFILGAGVDVNQFLDEAHGTALHVAIEQDNLEITQMLLDAGADPNTMSYGCTAVQHAVDITCDGAWQAGEEPTLDLIRLLISRGADPERQNQFGKSARDWARQYAYQDALDLFDTVPPDPSE